MYSSREEPLAVLFFDSIIVNPFFLEDGVKRKNDVIIFFTFLHRHISDNANL